MAKIRWAVVGLGYIAQNAVLPAFKNAGNAELTALVSDDPKKLKKLGAKYGVTLRLAYSEYETLLASGQVDAVYIAVPNHLHRDFAVAAFRRRRPGSVARRWRRRSSAHPFGSPSSSTRRHRPTEFRTAVHQDGKEAP